MRSTSRYNWTDGGATIFDPARQQSTLGPRAARARARMRAASPSSSPTGCPSPPRLSVGERCFCAAPDHFLAAAIAAVLGRRWHRAAAPFISPSLLARSAALVRFWGARYGTWRAYFGRLVHRVVLKWVRLLPVVLELDLFVVDGEDLLGGSVEGGGRGGGGGGRGPRRRACFGHVALSHFQGRQFLTPS